ncbi:MerR family transcriptional regulator [Amycolatopsis sp., V23-08]|uniref:MerR family transcriptional regulator n=1 Tax=Amycolatopsis heterodermiae TaxID=3110235 RepID=A0ABU5R4A9_9PSEU|nr:MerR family transcriptional regulator [Amycolatopsis sp., V23-08]MEA5361008.1 MerR family transcriptional regulator [Amycolatopsis sp., V23-08]
MPARPDGPTAAWTPGAVARSLGIAPSTLRSWHRRYDLPVTGAGSGPHRRYSGEDVAALSRMRRLVGDGMSVASAARLTFAVPASAWTGAADMVAAALRLDADAIAATLDEGLARDGVATTWDHWCRPALTTLGGPAAAPAGGHVTTCTDVVHLLSGVITTALHRVRPETAGGPVVLLACAPGERHTLPLEVLRAALGERGVPAFVLGTDLPTTALLQALGRTSRPAAALVLWAQWPRRPPDAVVTACASRRITLLTAGPGRDGPAHVTSLADALRALPEVGDQSSRHS